MASSTSCMYLTRPDDCEDKDRAQLRKECTPTHMTWSLQANEIVDRVFITDFYTATSATALTELGITHVISMLHNSSHKTPIDVAGHMHIPVADVSQSDILRYFDATTQFICDALASSPTNRVLVHCVWGMSRSVSVVIAYLVATRDLFYHEAFDLVYQRRSLARPNPGFTKQLVTYGVNLGVPIKRARASNRKRAAEKKAAKVGSGQAEPPTDFPRALSAIVDDEERGPSVMGATASLLKSMSLLKVVDTVTCS